MDIANFIPRFGENKPLMFLFYQFLVERIGEKEYSGPFVKVALKVCQTPHPD
jgi:hypothetical protein